MIPAYFKVEKIRLGFSFHCGGYLTLKPFFFCQCCKLPSFSFWLRTDNHGLRRLCSQCQRRDYEAWSKDSPF